MADLHDHDADPRPEGADPQFASADVDTSTDAIAPATADDAVLEDAAVAPPAPVVDESDEQRAEREAEERLLQLFQSTVFGADGVKIGRVGQVYLDDQTMAPNWVTVKTGLFGTKEFFVPLDEAEVEGKQIRVPYDKATILGSPRTEIDQNLSPAEEDDLYNHYRVPGRMTIAEPVVEPLGAGDVDDPAEPIEPAEPVEATEAPVEPDDDAPAPGHFEGFSGTDAEQAFVPLADDAPEVESPDVDPEAFAPQADEPESRS